MIPTKLARTTIWAFLVFVAFVSTAFGQGNRCKCELPTKDGAITIDYGCPALQGRDLNRDLIGQLKVGEFWRMGMNEATVLKTPIDLTFGKITVPKGNHSLLLKRQDQDNYLLVFNSQTGQWGTEHDSSRDEASVSAEKTKPPKPVDRLTIELRRIGGGSMTLTGVGGGATCSFVLTWGDTQITIPFTCPPGR